ncbi:hypothetical protein D3C71_1625120 [compost metagenome]
MAWIYWFKTFNTEKSANVLEKRIQDNWPILTGSEVKNSQLFKTKRGHYGVKYQ